MRSEFNKSLRNIAVPVLEAEGFLFDGKRRFTKSGANGVELIIEYQIGVRGAQGSFTVNLFAGDEYERLSKLKPTPVSKIVTRLFGEYNPWWRDIFLPKDKWWEISPFQKEMDAILRKTLADLKSYGIAWLESRG